MFKNFALNQIKNMANKRLNGDVEEKDKEDEIKKEEDDEEDSLVEPHNIVRLA
jgi:hypothetical protein